MNWKDQLPTLLLPDLQRFVQTERPCVRLRVTAAAPEHAWSSALGPIQYWPLAKTWPTDEQGRPLFGLLQLNLAELPHLPDLPAQGMLQFFISDDAFWGANPVAHQQAQRNYRVVYHPTNRPEAEPLRTDFSFLPEFVDLPLRTTTRQAISGQLERMPMPPEDVRFPRVLGDLFAALGDAQWDVLRQYRQAIGTVGHRLGGYPGFAQEDTRQGNPLPELLLQLDSDPDAELMWGDYGVAHWLYSPPSEVTERSLTADPFAQVTYSWENA
ncbi:MAG: DUF1963 domain-containing protein [Bacteroidota bacterium]